ncbi:N-acetylmuramoyl-L-alanine amidase [Flavobacterium sp. HSC-32F16]|uniref:N-acetylmuramoyl-L-alanine amidase family protein n=1 Tax=Flavobacterium sp. HSC-32F16 TaxID=2910964 RepID=UPI0020A43AC2|nr:N-acetylmuramoyl-L-alanine amidase [Flavobacterium sp. HSC-32F16]MCP2026459.1 N-acetylmuramoyl-L-alanine amidase [Flavobacterium sp. HSC-32F16]
MKTKIKFLAIVCLAVFVFMAFKPLDKKVILIDAGHGGYDSGVNKYGFEEKNITEAIARKIKEQSNSENVEIVLIRDGDISMNLTDRVTIINKLKPDLVLSLHVNSNSNMKANGVGAYISSNKAFHDQSKEIAEIAVNKIVSSGKLTKRYISEAPFHILKYANCNMVHLELGFLSNENDRNYITSEEGQNEIANKILESLN